MRMAAFWFVGRVVWWKFNEVSEELAASIIRAVNVADY
jgi:hypothetical protein